MVVAAYTDPSDSVLVSWAFQQTIAEYLTGVDASHVRILSLSVSAPRVLRALNDVAGLVVEYEIVAAASMGSQVASSVVALPQQALTAALNYQLRRVEALAQIEVVELQAPAMPQVVRVVVQVGQQTAPVETESQVLQAAALGVSVIAVALCAFAAFCRCNKCDGKQSEVGDVILPGAPQILSVTSAAGKVYVTNTTQTEVALEGAEAAVVETPLLGLASSPRSVQGLAASGVMRAVESGTVRVVGCCPQRPPGGDDGIVAFVNEDDEMNV